MAVMGVQFRGHWSVRSARIFLRRRERSKLATTVNMQASTREKLVRAKEASARLAQFSTQQKNSILLAMADAVEKRTASILRANTVDLETSRLTGPMRDRLLLTAERIAGMAQGMR